LMGSNSPGVGYYNDIREGTFEHKRMTINSNHPIAR